MRLLHQPFEGIGGNRPAHGRNRLQHSKLGGHRLHHRLQAVGRPQLLHRLHSGGGLDGGGMQVHRHFRGDAPAELRRLPPHVLGGRAHEALDSDKFVLVPHHPRPLHHPNDPGVKRGRPRFGDGRR